MELLLPVHGMSTWMMTGLIWFVQIVHYPLMAQVGRDRFPRYEGIHTSRTTWVVGPLMAAEGVTAVVLAVYPPAGVPPAAAWAGLAILVLIWLSTALLQVPMHRRLAAGFDAAAHGRLVSTNWIRTVAWSARSVLAFLWLA